MTAQQSPNPSSLRTRFTYRFLRALKELNKHRSATSWPSYRRVKVAADASMAGAVKSRRAWTRAVLRKIRRGHRSPRWHRPLATRELRRKIRKKHGGNPRKLRGSHGEFGQTNELRKLVPGGESMEITSLLGETAHYIKCLSTQVHRQREYFVPPDQLTFQ
ncbi:hypothetical protein RJ640_025335 [Escallonia rubra]|uniref:IBH1-like N-terminal domain-containing protein n=1 Tax=Escallonia rubra TaxID=112253 RepID=A0AA88QJJ6_9ASTE|nr:hypothetical protein RJ640_025335 [Escallonia rubra]